VVEQYVKHWAKVDVPDMVRPLQPLCVVMSQLELYWIWPLVVQLKVGRDMTDPHDWVESIYATGLNGDEAIVKKVQVVPENVK